MYIFEHLFEYINIYSNKCSVNQYGKSLKLDAAANQFLFQRI